MLKFSLQFMEKQITITKEAKKILEEKKAELQHKIGATPESVHLQEALSEVTELLENSVIENKNDPALVKIGSKVVVENLVSGDTREYKIMTRQTANPLSGIISNESPLAQRILGLKLGNTFKFIEGSSKEQTFKIKSID